MPSSKPLPGGWTQASNWPVAQVQRAQEAMKVRADCGPPTKPRTSSTATPRRCCLLAWPTAPAPRAARAGRSIRSGGMGGVKRITITAASNFKTGMKIQMIDTVIDRMVISKQSLARTMTAKKRVRISVSF